MSATVSVQLDIAKILAERGLGTDNKAQKFLCNEVWRMSDPYTPFDQGMLKSNVSIAIDGSSITYNSPYAKYQFYGVAMAGNAPKKATDKSLKYEGAPLRGSFWNKRMWNARGEEITKAVASLMGGKAE